MIEKQLDFVVCMGCNKKLLISDFCSDFAEELIIANDLYGKRPDFLRYCPDCREESINKSKTSATFRIIAGSLRSAMQKILYLFKIWITGAHWYIPLLPENCEHKDLRR